MIRPKQRITTADRTEDWWKESARWFADSCIPAMDQVEAQILYRAANGQLQENDYLYVTNPFNSKDPKFTRFPAKIRNFDIISTNVMLMMGEKRKRGLRYTVVARDSDIDSQRKELENQLVEKLLVQQIMSELQQQTLQNGEQFDVEVSQQYSVEKIKKMVDSLPDKLAIMGQEALDYIRDYNRLDSIFAEAWYHFLVTAKAFTYKGIYKDEVIEKAVSPKEIWYLANSHDTFLEDCEAIKRLVRMPLTEVIDKFQDMKGFTDDVIRELESRLGYDGGEGFYPKAKLNGYTDQDTWANEVRSSSALWNKLSNDDSKIYSDQEGIQVEHIVWTTLIKIGKVSGANIFGEEFEEEVDDTYKAIPGEEVEWTWVKQKCEAYIIDDKYIVGYDFINELRGSINEPNAVKNPYNGKILAMKHTDPMSIVKKGIPYQIKYNIVHYYIEKSFAKNLDKITVFPLGLIPNKEGHSMESTMYYASAFGFMFPDETSKNFQTALNGVKILDASLSQHINRLYEYLNVIKEEWDASIGMSGQRKGQMNASDGKAVAQEAIFRSSIMTEEYFTQFEELEESDLNGLLELSKYAFSEGKKANYINSDLKRTMLQIDPNSFCFSKYLVRASNSGKDLMNLEAVRAQATQFAQNGASPSTVTKIITANNVSKLMEELEDLELQFEAKQQAAQKAQNDAMIQAEQVKADNDQAKREVDYYKIDKDYEKAVEVARIGAESKLSSDFMNATGGQEEIAGLEERSIKREELFKKDQLAREQLSKDEEKNKRDNDTKRYVADKQYSIAKVNKN